MPDADTQLVGILGWPLGHSLSPRMHNAAFAALGLNWCYQPFPVPPDQFGSALAGLAPLGIRGFNLTIPYKEIILPYLDSIDPQARQLGAVNTVLVSREEGPTPRLHGTNTDVAGFINGLKAAGVSLSEIDSVVVIGAGGAARAVVHGLVSQGVRDIHLFNRSIVRANKLAEDLQGSCPCLSVFPLDEENLLNHTQKASLLVNTTPLGTWPDTGKSFWPAHVPVPAHLAVFDLVYNPLQTRLLQQAEKDGAHPISGLEMLVQQGALAFELWTGVPAPLDVMRKACISALGGNQ